MEARRKSPLVDVLIPAFNAERTIRQALASIQCQTIGNFRVIVVNDGSTDRTSELAHAAADADSRICVIDQSNGGIVVARNRLIEHSTAPYLAMHDADDRSFPDRLERQLAYLEGHPDCVAVSGNAWNIDQHGRRAGGRSHFGGDVEPDPYAIPSAEPYLPQPFVMIRRDAMMVVAGYREMTNAEDTDLYWRLLSVGRLHNLADIVGEYRMHAVSASSASARNGRLSALHSQLAALSYRRRRSDVPDLEVTAETARQLAASDDMEQMLACVSSQLDAAEIRYLRPAFAAKLLELASYRPYLLTDGDCRFIHDALPVAREGKSWQQRSLLVYQQAHILAKLLYHGRWREIAAFRASASVYANILPALTMRRGKALLQSWRNRPAPA